MPKPKNTKLSVFKGREARLNRAIFQSLALKGPQTIYSIHSQVKVLRNLRNVRYANVNVRVRKLEELSYLSKVGVKKTKAGFQATVYNLTAKAYFALFINTITLEELFNQLDETTANRLIADVIDVVEQARDNMGKNSHRNS